MVLYIDFIFIRLFNLYVVLVYKEKIYINYIIMYVYLYVDVYKWYIIVW